MNLNLKYSYYSKFDYTNCHFSVATIIADFTVIVDIFIATIDNIPILVIIVNYLTFLFLIYFYINNKILSNL